MNISNEILMNAAKYQGCAFSVSELLRENQQGGGGAGRVKVPPTQIRVKSKTGYYGYSSI